MGERRIKEQGLYVLYFYLYLFFNTKILCIKMDLKIYTFNLKCKTIISQFNPSLFYLGIRIFEG